MPAIEVSPNVVDLGTVDRGALSTPRVSVTVTNVSRTEAQVRLKDTPKWLLIKPEAFSLAPGARQVVQLVGRVANVRGRRQRVRLIFAVNGGRDQEIEVRLKIRRSGLFG
jgi:hypothetical protein